MNALQTIAMGSITRC